MIYLFLNSDEYLVTQRIAQFKAAMGDAEMADLNTSTLSGGQTTAAELLGQASMMPFLSTRRLLVADEWLSHLDKRMAASKGTESAAHGEAAQLLTALATLDESSDVVFVESKSIDKRRHLWKGFKTKDRAGEQVAVPGLADLIKQKVVASEELNAPDPKQLPIWIKRRIDQKQIAVDGRAITMLADYVGPNLRQLDNELDKLAAYAAGRTITADDVQAMVSDASEAVIWNLTDALSRRNGRMAMQTLYELRRNDANPFYLLTMIARQYRIIIKVKDAMAQGMGNEYDIAKHVKESPYPVKKAMQQARGYTFEELDGIMEQLLTMDMAMKTGANPDTELDVLIAELTRSPARSR